MRIESLVAMLRPATHHARLVLAAAVASSGAAAAAQPHAAGEQVQANRQASRGEQAQLLFEQGRGLLAQGELAAACPLLARSYELEHATGALLASALCHDRAGRLATAYREYGEVAKRARKENNPERERVALERTAALQTRLSTLTIKAVGPAGLRVKLNGESLSAAQLGKAIPVDGGEQRVEASADHRRGYEASVTIGDSADAQEIVIPELEREAVPAPLEDPARAAERPARRLLPKPAERSRSRGMSGEEWVGITAMGLGAVGLGVGTYFAIREATSEGEADVCDDCDADDRDIAHMGFVVGGVLVGIGALTYFLMSPASGSESASRSDPSLAGAVWVLPDAGGGAISGRF